jgi:hypothetical protein
VQASDREQAAGDREQAALVRDWEATTRDAAAERRDRAADRRRAPVDASHLGGYEQVAIDRELDASDRHAAAGDRRAADHDRAAADQDRAAAASDARAAVADRAAAVADREAAKRDRAAAAQDRWRAAADREQAVVERAQHRPDAALDPILRQSHQLVVAVRGRAQAIRGRALETARTMAGMVEEATEAKQRELTAHLASIQAHELVAELHEQLGHPERVATARARAKRAREFHQMAVAELADFLARIKAIEDRRAGRRRDGVDRAGG